jgi:hypothetical protein
MPRARAHNRRGGRLGAAVAATALALALSLLPAATAGAAPHVFKTGVSYVYSFENDPAAFEHVRAAGARYVLTPLSWGRIVPRQQPANWHPDNPSDPHYQWGAYDLWVTRAVEAGLTPVLQVRGAPLWASRCHTTDVDVPCRPDPAALAAFATAAAHRYSGSFHGLPRVRYWQGMNEPNLSLFFKPQFEGPAAVSADIYRELINAFYFAIKTVNPDNQVMAAGLGPVAVPGYTVGPLRFTRELLCMRDRRRPTSGDCGGGVHFDIYDVHPYTTGGPTHEGGPNDVQLGDLPDLVELLRAADRAGRIKNAASRTPLWVTEFAWDSNPPDPGGLSMPILSRWAAEALHGAWRAGIDTFFWFSLRDGAPDIGQPSYESPESGLYFRGPTIAEDQPKGVLFAFRFPFVAYPGKQGLRFWGRTPSGRGGRVTIQVRRDGRWRRLLVTRANGAGLFMGIAETRYGRGERGAARATYAGGNSVPFSMTPVPDFRQPPFGAETAAG